MEPDSSVSPAGTGYTGAPVAGAALATLLFPYIALIAALLLRGGQSDMRKKAQLRAWAWASGGWLLLGVLVVVVLSSVGSHPG
jgi:hypothetical protein